MPASYAFPTDLGWFALAWTDNRLSRLTFGHPTAAAAVANLDLDSDWTATDRRDLPAWVADLAERLAAYASGEEGTFADVPIEQSHLSLFQKKVVAACRKIGRGRTRTYGDLAAAAGSPGAARAVGSVMSHNRFPIIVPCHRVVGSAGSLGGFSAPDGLGMKRKMLELEGAEIRKPRKTRIPRKQLLAAK